MSAIGKRQSRFRLRVVPVREHLGQLQSDGGASGPDVEQLELIYRAFNAREVDVVLEQLAPDIRWPNGWEGGELYGRQTVRDYWLRQWAAIDPTVTPLAFTRCPDGSIAVTVDQRVDDLEGGPISHEIVTHVYRFAGGLVTAMEIRAATADEP